MLDFDFPFFSYNFGLSLLSSSHFGCHNTFILSNFLDHSDLGKTMGSMIKMSSMFCTWTRVDFISGKNHLNLLWMALKVIVEYAELIKNTSMFNHSCILLFIPADTLCQRTSKIFNLYWLPTISTEF